MASLELRDYQKPIVEEVIKHKEGLIVMSTGSGKTVVAMNIIKRLGLTTTILVPKTDLGQQFFDECVKWLGFEPAMIDGKRKEIGKVTIATFQSLFANEKLLAELSNNTSVLIVDEAQGAVTDRKIEVLEAFKPLHLYGLTGTPMREDGKTAAISFYFGKHIAEYHTTQMNPSIEVWESGSKIPADEYPRMIDALVADEGRNKLITAIVGAESLAGRKILVLTKRVEHAQILFEPFNILPGAFLIGSKDKEKNRKLADLKSGKTKFRIIFGTTALLSVGTDVPSLDTLVLACDMKGEVLTVQSVGRILRLFEGKPSPKIIDIADRSNHILKRQNSARLGIYRARGWPLEFFG